MPLDAGLLGKGRKALRKGWTTGTCAAAAAKAAAQALFGSGPANTVSVTLPGGKSATLKVRGVNATGSSAYAYVVKDAGDDPDVTNGAVIAAEVALKGMNRARASVSVRGGRGVGVVTKPGLKVPPGRPAINPVPMKMIRRAVLDAARAAGVRPSLTVTVVVPEGEELAKKTMNARLGILGGISILGTTGVVEPMSLAAYTHSISAALDVAEAAGIEEVILSTGRSSEKALESGRGLPEAAYILTGDHMGFALREASKRRGIRKVTVAAQFGKLTKLASNHFETHCEDVSVDFAFIAEVCAREGAGATAREAGQANTARQVFFILKEKGHGGIIRRLASMARENASRIVRPGLLVKLALVGYDGKVEELV